jgi:outer membrane protein
MTKIAIGAALAALALAVPGAAVAQRGGSPDILVVDIGRISSECNACRAAAQQLTGQATAFEQRRQQLAQQLQTAQQPLSTAIEALGGKQPDPALQGRIRAYESQRTAAEQEIQNRGNQLQSIGANVNLQIETQLRGIVEQIRAQRNASIVIAKGAAWANAPAIDITNEALAALNQRLPAVSLTPLPQQAQPQGR